MRRRAAEEPDDGVVEPVAKGFVRLWLAAKLLPIAIRLIRWATWLAGFAAYAGYVAWKVRRMVRRGALDEPDGITSPVSAQEDGVVAWVRGEGVTRQADVR